MSPGERPEAIDTRLVFRVYALLGFLGGIATTATGVWWIRTATSLPGGPAAVLFGLFSILNWTLALWAAAFARVDDPSARLSGLKMFAAAHVVVAALLWTLYAQFQGALVRFDSGIRTFDTPEAAAIFAWLPYRPATTALFVTGVVLLYLAYTASPGSRFVMTMRSTTTAPDSRPRMLALRDKARGASARQLRARFEEHIRQAARQEERARLARDLHDAVKQQLFVIQTAAATTQARFDADPAGARAALDQVREAAREAIAEMAAMLDQLQAAPVENTGLIEILRKQCEALGFRTGAEVSFDAADLPPAHLLAPGAQQAVVRVAQEALANVGRHARPGRVAVRLHRDAGALVLDVTDDGAGFDPLAARRGMGIQNMQARAQEVGGRLDVASGPGAGTTITFAVPLTAHSPRRYLLTAAAFAAALVASALLTAGETWNQQPWAHAAAAIAAIGAVRYAVAFHRARSARAIA